MMSLTPVSLNTVAVIGAHCDDIVIGAGATLIEIARGKPDLVIHALVLTGGGTGSSAIDIGLHGLTELQPGSYVFMDCTYRRIRWDRNCAPAPFEAALSVSRASPTCSSKAAIYPSMAC